MAPSKRKRRTSGWADPGPSARVPVPMIGKRGVARIRWVRGWVGRNSRKVYN